MKSKAQALINKIKGKVKGVIDERKRIQKNWENRKDNSNYYGSYKDFK